MAIVLQISHLVEHAYREPKIQYAEYSEYSGDLIY